MKKTIGILGGMGSWATLKFFEHILNLSEPDEFRILIDNNVNIPSRTKAVKEGTDLGKVGENGTVADGMYSSFVNLNPYIPEESVVKSGRRVIIAVPCNSAHHWYNYLTGKDGHVDFFIGHWLNMIEAVSNAVKAQGHSRPLILGGYVTVEKKLYSKYLQDAVYLSDEGNEAIYEIIQKLKQNKCVDAFYKIQSLCTDQRRNIDCVLLACTEFSMIPDLAELGMKYMIEPVPIIDSSYEYAKAVVEYARRGDG